MRRISVAVAGAVLTVGTEAAIAASGSLIDEFGNCHPLKSSDNENVALRVVLGWGFEGIRHSSEPDPDKPGERMRTATDNSWKVTVYKDRNWLLSRGRSRESSNGKYVQELCTILRGEKAMFFTEGEFSSEKHKLTP
ncbi:hypothetical protein BB934_19365 [Microvirga ossetica]|uniref:Uncharacterized protein n=1 Tax=Microvirga ossetica TaxID=1882682 RepID=A0A1B2EJJ8_9HYPH|nr:hypothetical protein [Microvirga ossetica]ANY80119.1 hypothetical protein BB934_19365 [Microvirga ossetica]